MLDWKHHPNLLRHEETLLVVVDIQDSLLRVIHDSERLIANCVLLIESAKILGVPILATTQYAARLGSVAPEIASHLPEATSRIDKLSFSCVGSPEFQSALEELHRRQVLLCGLETHICIAQTALDLVANGYQVHVAADAVSSRTMEKHKLGMERIRDSAVLPCAAEAAVYELLQRAGTPEFKASLPLVK